MFSIFARVVRARGSWSSAEPHRIPASPGGVLTSCVLLLTIAGTWALSPQAMATTTVAWTSHPTEVETGETYTISAIGTNLDGHLVSIQILKGTTLFNSGTSDDGYEAWANGSTSDVGDTTIRYTAQAFGLNGDDSEIIT